jgi:hypothetical protein
MNASKYFLPIGLLVAFSFSAQAAADKAMAHLSVRKEMQNTGVLPAASGRVDLNASKKNGSTSQKLHVHLKGLEADAAYQLQATIGADPNPITVEDFSAQSDGNANLDFKSTEKAKGSSTEVKGDLPAALNPVTNIRSLSVVDAGGQTVLTVDVNALQKLHYMVKRKLTEGDIKGNLHIKASDKGGEVRLDAKELNPESDYSLALNGAIVATSTSDKKGKVKLKTELADPFEVLSLNTVELRDASGGVVLSATLP